jgi:hypothetical protein
MQADAAAVQRAVITGPAISIPGFPERLGDEIGLSFEIGVIAEGRPGGFGGLDAGRLAVAAGLSVEEVAA